MESPKVARSLYVYKSQLATHRQIIKQFYSPLSWHNLTISRAERHIEAHRKEDILATPLLRQLQGFDFETL